MYPTAFRHLRLSLPVLLVAALTMSACDSCQEKPTPKPDVATPPPVTEPDLPEADPLEEAREDAEVKAVPVAIAIGDRARLVAADIEAAQAETTKVKPTPKIRRNTGPSGELDPEAAAKEMARYEGAMRKCYERALKAQPGLQGSVTLKITVASSGKVRRVSAVQDSLRSDTVEDCMKGYARRMKFPEPRGGDAVLAKTYTFEPQF